ncbi:vesicle-trafficking protein SEC22c isoform X1 [Zootoca vivipara]|uniref:vesicle-trafficking protein SEC22c isoform X1 n=1 Tax=Zootoca vivipara TaxID=8524 RepID=UPI00293BB9A8|nr:vesicle-trafficking protein SEC22c isoform X1 [Zootoca vivipara]XP_060136926.1 vesicle-trafficking protein SEC22c isoform X1 [Zootoca vivipara]
MSMILFACVVRVRDGLPLSASTDFHLDQDFLECRKRLKTLSSILTQYPERGTAKECDLSIHFHSSGDVACMGICTSSFPAAMAFCFLEELQWEFATTYDATSVGLASRPYAFLEFDNVIQKVKGRFNYTNCAQTKFNLEKIQEELLLRPPALVKLEDAELRNGIVNGHTELCMESGRPQRNWKCDSISPALCSLLFVVLPLPVLQFRQEDKGLCTFCHSLSMQHLPVWFKEHLADTFPHRSGLPFFPSDIDTASCGETARLWSMKAITEYQLRVVFFLKKCLVWERGYLTLVKTSLCNMARVFFCHPAFPRRMGFSSQLWVYRTSREQA